jgi:hypothetical protein
MHANLSITDGVYGVLSSMDVKREIIGLGKNADFSTSEDVEELKR